ncbi:MAG: M48 family metallopeptidase [Planctomycetota bacterium]|nr:M48 family metallopeptidase [Planctomycetota bacterium]MDA1180574.1 M48 family metallopeptidase [Planctomycetota bacterium]
MRDFHERQKSARAQTRYLIVLLTAALIGLVLTASCVVTYAVFLVRLFAVESTPPVFEPCVMGIAATLTLIAISLGCAWKAQQLQHGGGVAVAGLLHARLVREGDQMPARERQLLNVVQEISIAAGIQAPYVCVLDQDLGINAFAAGYTLRDAVIGVTRGCLENLSRDQLQGVIAHECSHILNGDMRLNMRTLIVLHGVFSLDILGRWLCEIAKYQWETATDLEDDFVGKCVMGILLPILGTGLIVLGCLGTLCGLIISAAVSRQREFLADASSVELTRNPLGIADALKVIAGYRAGTQVRSVLAAEVNHMFFCPTTRLLIKSLSSHPPVEERIRRLDPEWNGIPLFEDETTLGPVPDTLGQAMQLVGGGQAQQRPTSSDNDTSCFSINSDTSYLYGIDASIPEVLHDLSESAQGCHLLLLALVSETSLASEDTLAQLTTGTDVDTARAVLAIQPAVARLTPEQTLRLFDVALDCWNSQPTSTRARIRKSVLAPSNNAVSIDWMRWSLREQLRPYCEGAKAKIVACYGTYAETGDACETVVSALVYAGHEEGPTAEYAFHRAIAHFEKIELVLRTPEECGPREVAAAIRELAQLSHRAKRSLMLAISRSISADQAIAPNEAALMRGICAGLRVTVPRLLPGQPVAPGI